MNKLIQDHFKKIGFDVIFYNDKPSANGVDCWVKSINKKPLSVEIKKARKQKNGCFQVDPVSKPRLNDDLIAIIINEDYVLIESMEDHKKCCSQKGTRQMTILCGGQL